MKKFLSVTIFSTLLFGAASAQAAPVEVYLTSMLDNAQNGYCLDVAKGKGEAANPDDGLQGHTCYSPLGELGYDQTFSSERFSDGVLHMTNFDVCAQISSATAGAAVDLAACDGESDQSFVITDGGTITPASAPNLCLTVGEATRSGRSDANQIKVLSLEACSAEQASYQNWSWREL